MKYYIITYGCQMNKNDSERIASFLENLKYKPASNKTEADLIVVNACSVRQSAVDRIYGNIRNFKKLKERNPKLKTILTGCVLTEDKIKFRKKASFDFILDINDLPNWSRYLTKKNKISLSDLKSEDGYFVIEPKYQNHFSAFLPIITGCNNFCSFCVVPYTRGKEISRPAEKIIQTAKELIKRGYKEILLLGQNVNSYSYSSINFPMLLKLIDDIPGNFWIRFISSHPKDFSDELIDVMAESKKVTPYLHLPVQSGDNDILRKMNRPYTVEKYIKLVKKIRKRIPNISISTDIIVGFPGENKKQFQNTLKLFKKIKFDMAYIAKYSERAGTAAARLKDDISLNEKERRWKILSNLLEKISSENNKKYIGKNVEILAEEKKGEFLIGKTKTYKTVKFKGNKNMIGNFISVKIIDAFPWGLKGEI